MDREVACCLLKPAEKYVRRTTASIQQLLLLMQHLDAGSSFFASKDLCARFFLGVCASAISSAGAQFLVNGMRHSGTSRTALIENFLKPKPSLPAAEMFINSEPK